MAKKMSQEGQHVAVFAFPFASHPFALFNLVCKVARATPEVEFSFFNTEKSNNSVLSTLHNANNLPINIKAYNVDDGVPEDYDLAKNQFKEDLFFINAVPENFKRGMDLAVTEIGRRISLLVTDAMSSFSVGKMAEDMNVPWVSFWVASPCSLSAHLHTDLIQQLYTTSDQVQPEEQTLEAIPGLSEIRFKDLPTHILLAGEQSDQPDDFVIVSSMMQKIGVKLPQASAVVINSYEEVTPTLLTNDLKSKFQNLLYVGISSFPTSVADATGCLSWLDGHNAASVAYISFGTAHMTLSQEELVALAEALEASGVSFLWSLKDSLKNNLPDGFLERMSMRGKVVPWAPQSQVLAHTSVGVHVTHCGYNALCESILCGVPMICRSVWADNHINARMVEKVWRIGVRVENGVITKSGMLKSLEIIFQHEKGKQMRGAIGVLKDQVLQASGPDGSAAKDFKTLVKIISSI